MAAVTDTVITPTGTIEERSVFKYACSRDFQKTDTNEKEEENHEENGATEEEAENPEETEEDKETDEESEKDGETPPPPVSLRFEEVRHG